MMLVAVTIVVAVALTLGALTLLPEGDDPGVRPDADFSIERDDGDVVVDPQYMTEDTPFTLLINGREVYEWDGGNTERERRLSCLEPGDAVAVRADAGNDRTYLIEDHEVETQTACALSGTGTRFAYAQVGSRRVALKDPAYDFTLAIDPDGPTSVLGDTDFPTTNPWVYVERFDRTVEGFAPPVYVVVFPDNVGSRADWESDPSEAEREEMSESFELDGSDVQVTAGGVEPTDDVYLVFKPGCSASRFKFIRMQGAYNNQILLDGDELFRTDDATRGQVYTGPGVECT